METLNVFGAKFVSHPAFSYGDYDNSGAVERANVRYLIKEHAEHCIDARMSDIGAVSAASQVFTLSDYAVSKYTTTGWIEDEALKQDYMQAEVIRACGGYGSVQVWIRADIEEEQGYCGATDDYPVLDDSIVSEIECEMFSKALEDWIISDIQRDVEEALECDDEEEKQYTIPDEFDFGEAIRTAMNELSIYPTFECTDVCFDKSDIADIGCHIADSIREEADNAEREEREAIRTQDGRQVELF